MTDLVDVALVLKPDGIGADVAVAGADLLGDAGLETAVLLSVFTDRRADVTDVLPLGETDRRGWWADREDRKLGSRLWLLDREKRTPATIARAQDYVSEALAWLVSDGVAKSVDVTVESLTPADPLWSSVGPGIAIRAAIARPDDNATAVFRFGRAWKALAP